MRTYQLAILGGICIAFLTGAFVFFGTPIGCTPIPTITAEMGSQGFRLWSGPTLLSFEHGNKKICIPDEWVALGETASGSGWARYEEGMTGVAIEKRSFREASLSFVSSSYDVRVVYPENTSAEELELYEATIRSAFENIGSLFNDSNKKAKDRHTVLVTPGVLRLDGLQTPIYPDPRKNLSIYMRPPTSSRVEELIIHAVAHLYNRQRVDLLAYQKNQSPIPAGDFQELEASWSEVAFRTSDEGRRARIDYLYNVHTAVQTKNFSLLTSGPFNTNRTEFEKIRANIIVPEDASFLTAQYGHYILGPLIMTATEGMLVRKKSDTTIQDVLSRVHAEQTSYFDELSAYLSPEEITEIRSWMFEGATVRRALVDAGVTHYELQ